MPQPIDTCNSCGRRNTNRERWIAALIRGQKRIFCKEACKLSAEAYANRSGGECPDCREQIEEAGETHCARCRQERANVWNEAR